MSRLNARRKLRYAGCVKRMRGAWGQLGCALLCLFSSQAQAQLERAPTAAETQTLAPRLYANGFLLWIYERPEQSPAPIGALRAGQSVALREVPGHTLGSAVKKGCGRGWFAVEPTGYVCLDQNASLDPTRYSQSMALLLPRPGPYPFEFALSMGTPSYRRVPLQHEWLRKERVFGPAGRRPLPPHWAGHEQLAQNPQLPSAEMLDFLAQRGSIARADETRLVRRDVQFGSMVALTRTFLAHGREFGQSADGTLMPMDRLVVFQKSSFSGVELRTGRTSGPTLPLAWPRRTTMVHVLSQGPECQPPMAAEPGPQQNVLDPPVHLPGDCTLRAATELMPGTPHHLTGRVVTGGGKTWAQLATADPAGGWVAAHDLHIAEAVPSPPLSDPAHEVWISFTISQGTLVVYRGQTPVFATLASPGSGGTPRPGDDPLATRTTPVGRFRITFKYRSDDMSPEQSEHRDYFIADVPFALYFQQPFAIHVAYWHETFGMPMSGGCINVSPRDGERLFTMTSPRVPDDWYAAGPSPVLGQGTQIVVRR